MKRVLELLGYEKACIPCSLAFRASFAYRRS